MSLPTLRNDLARIYEPKAPAPSQRLATLHAARQAGLHIYVAMAPTYPECDKEDLFATLCALAKLDPVTIFHEPINIRAENVARIQAHADTLHVQLHTEVFSSQESWREYAVRSLQTVESLAGDLGIANRVHLWPDKSLGNQATIRSMPQPAQYQQWLNNWWTRVSEWPH